MDKIHVGTMGWSYKFWVDNFYPKNLATGQYLTEYAKHFDTVEIDSTFYRTPSKSTVERWKDQTPPDFLFSAKFPKTITHEKVLRNCEVEVDRFIERISHLRPKLGPLLLQFPSTFKTEHLHLLSDFLPSLPKGHRIAVEVRNKKLLIDRLYSILRENGAALTILDRPSMPEIEVMTTDFTYIRWEGDRKKVSGTLGKIEIDRLNEIKAWAQKTRGYLKTPVEVFGYFSKYYSGHPPTDVQQLLQALQPNFA
jgi:uncharacterized protein YecE (DUF72 family)